MSAQLLTDELTRRRFGIGVGAASVATLLAACSTDDRSPTEQDTRTVTHDQGSTEVTIRPERVVALDSLPIDTVVSLGVNPVGAARAGSADELPAYLGAALAETTVVGPIAEPNLEAVAALRPDLILSSTQRHGELYEQLSAIAPTVFTVSPAVDWQGSIALFAEAMGRADEARDRLAAFAARAEGLRSRSAGRTAHIVRVMEAGVRLHGPATFAGSVLTAAGLQMAEAEYDAKNDMSELSFENMSQVDSDLAFVATTNPPGDLGIPPQLVSALGAGGRGGIFQTDYRIWITGIGLTGANLILDDLEQML